jgi:hypothetical protein
MPWQREQVVLIRKKPWVWVTWPRPPQAGQMVFRLPGRTPLPWQV